MDTSKYPSSIPTSVDIDRGKIKMGFKTAVSIVIFLITITVGAVTFGVNMVSRADVDEAIDNHSKTVHKDPSGKPLSAPYITVDTVHSNEEEIAILKSKMASIESKIDESITTQRYIQARIDFIIERELIKSQMNPTERHSIEKAAKRVRNKNSDMSEDPLAGIEGL